MSCDLHDEVDVLIDDGFSDCSKKAILVIRVGGVGFDVVVAHRSATCITFAVFTDLHGFLLVNERLVIGLRLGKGNGYSLLRIRL